MGSSGSKLKSNDGKDKRLPESVPSTPLKSSPSNLQNLCHLDPRSPSEDILRTPIQITRDDDTDTSNLALEYVIDPRSPTDQFERTPIVIKGNITDYPKTLHNKLLDNVKRNITYSPNATPKTKCDTNSLKSSPKLISSIPAFRKCNEKRKSFVGLLETNIDFTETNLDDIVRNKSLDKSLSISINEAPFCEIVEHKNCDPRSPSKDFLRTPIQIVHKVGEADLNNVTLECESEQVPKFEECHNSESLLILAHDESCLEYDKDIIEGPVFPTQDSDRKEVEDNNCDEQGLIEENKSESPVVNYVPETEIGNVVPCTLDPHNVEKEEQVENTVQMMAEIVEDLIGNISTLTTEELEENKLETKETIIDLTADVQEFDKKLTKIIQDNNENFSFKKNIQKDKLSENTRKRTPMKDRNEISEPRRNRLKVSDKPRKLNYDVSKIPVFRDKNGFKTKIQCENTPPAEMNIRRKKSSQPKWDSDKTLVI